MSPFDQDIENKYNACLEDFAKAVGEGKERMIKVALRIVEQRGEDISVDSMAKHGLLVSSAAKPNAVAFLWKKEHILTTEWDITTQAVRFIYHADPIFPIKL